MELRQTPDQIEIYCELEDIDIDVTGVDTSAFNMEAGVRFVRSDEDAHWTLEYPQSEDADRWNELCPITDVAYIPGLSAQPPGDAIEVAGETYYWSA